MDSWLQRHRGVVPNDCVVLCGCLSYKSKLRYEYVPQVPSERERKRGEEKKRGGNHFKKIK